MKTPALPVIDSRGALVGWKTAPRRILVRPPTVIMVTDAPKSGDDIANAFVPGMLLRVVELRGDGLMFEVLHEGER